MAHALHLDVVFDAPWLHVDIEAPSIAPDDPSDWMRRVVVRGTSAIDTVGVGESGDGGDHVRVLGSVRGRSARGWLVEIADTIVVRDGAIVEHRLIAMYEMLGHVAAVIARVADRECYVSALQPMLLPLVASARPVWRSRSPVALAELWSLAVSPPSG